jgi:hypothetical protein
MYPEVEIVRLSAFSKAGFLPDRERTGARDFLDCTQRLGRGVAPDLGTGHWALETWHLALGSSVELPGMQTAIVAFGSVALIIVVVLVHRVRSRKPPRR